MTTNVDFSDAKLQFEHGASTYYDDLGSDFRLRLANVLQVTLDVDQLLSLFFDEIQAVISLDGLRYINEAEGSDIDLGTEARHSCNYRLVTPKDTLGEVTFYRGSRFDEDELARLETLLNSLVYPLRNTLQYRHAVQRALRDPLTGAGNRVALDNAMRRELELCRRHGQQFSVMMVDLDRFKAINDTFGHTMGDRVLRELTNNMTAAIRLSDTIFRYGGEEFVILLPKTNTEGAMAIAERVRIMAAALRCDANDSRVVQVTVSIGLSTYLPGDTMESIIDRADRALYIAKANGRNQVRFLDE